MQDLRRLVWVANYLGFANADGLVRIRRESHDAQVLFHRLLVVPRFFDLRTTKPQMTLGCVGCASV